MTSLALLLMSAAVSTTAPGFPDWDGVSDKNYISGFGRYICTSDLRHKATIVVQVMNDATLPKQLQKAASFSRFMPATRKDTLTPWEMVGQIPRDSIVLLSVMGKRNDDKVREAATSITKDNPLAAAWKTVPAYMNVTMIGDSEEGKQYPYVYVFAPTDTDPPLWKGTLTDANSGEILKAYKDALKNVDEKWKPITGVAEIKHLPSVPKLIAAQKFDAAKAVAKAALKSADGATATEAQIVYDAIEQYKSDLVCKIQAEWQESPAKAFIDAQYVFKAFPAEKKKLAALEQKMKTDKNVQTLGKALMKVLEWKREGFEPKPAEAKKIVAELQKMNKSLKTIADDKTVGTRISTQAMVVQGEVDSLLDVMKAKATAK